MWNTDHVYYYRPDPVVPLGCPAATQNATHNPEGVSFGPYLALVDVGTVRNGRNVALHDGLCGPRVLRTHEPNTGTVGTLIVFSTLARNQMFHWAGLGQIEHTSPDPNFKRPDPDRRKRNPRPRSKTQTRNRGAGPGTPGPSRTWIHTHANNYKTTMP